MSTDDADRAANTGVDASLTRHGGLTYLEISAADPKKSATFYAAVLGWKCEGDVVVKFSDPDGFLIGRIIPNPVASRPGMIPYFYVNEIDEAAKRVAELGGTIVEAPYAQGNLRVAVVSDPAGNVIGLWQAATS